MGKPKVKPIAEDCDYIVINSKDNIVEKTIEAVKAKKGFFEDAVSFIDNALFFKVGRPSVFAGCAGCGKTTFLLTKCLHDCLGKPFLDFLPCQSTPTLYCNPEQGGNEIARRYIQGLLVGQDDDTLEKIKNNFDILNEDDLPILSSATSEETQKRLLEWLAQKIDWFKSQHNISENQIVQCVLDSAFMLFGARFNNPSSCKSLFEELKKLSIKKRCAFVLGLHLERCGKSEPTLKKVAGSSKIVDYSDSVFIYFASANENGSKHRFLRCVKGEKAFISAPINLEDNFKEAYKTKSKYDIEVFRLLKSSKRDEVIELLKRHFSEIITKKEAENALRSLLRAKILGKKGNYTDAVFFGLKKIKPCSIISEEELEDELTTN